MELAGLVAGHFFSLQILAKAENRAQRRFQVVGKSVAQKLQIFPSVTGWNAHFEQTTSPRFTA
jgi:hypothetical protein